MSDWEPGDLALCIKVTHDILPGIATDLRVGALYTVTIVGRPQKRIKGERALGLKEVQPWIPGRGYPETLFVKITPEHKIEGSEVDQKDPWKVSA